MNKIEGFSMSPGCAGLKRINSPLCVKDPSWVIQPEKSLPQPPLLLGKAEKIETPK